MGISWVTTWDEDRLSSAQSPCLSKAQGLTLDLDAIQPIRCDACAKTDSLHALFVVKKAFDWRQSG